MFCPNCGTQLPDTARFCASCGSEINRAVRNIIQNPETALDETQPSTLQIEVQELVEAAESSVDDKIIQRAERVLKFLETEGDPTNWYASELIRILGRFRLANQIELYYRQRWNHDPKQIRENLKEDWKSLTQGGPAELVRRYPTVDQETKDNILSSSGLETWLENHLLKSALFAFYLNKHSTIGKNDFGVIETFVGHERMQDALNYANGMMKYVKR